MEHAVITYNLSGKRMYEAHYATKEDAHKAWLEIIENAMDTLPKGRGINVVRYNDGHPMAVETVIGTR